jgi:hypothetical protein
MKQRLIFATPETPRAAPGVQRFPGDAEQSGLRCDGCGCLVSRNPRRSEYENPSTELQSLTEFLEFDRVARRIFRVRDYALCPGCVKGVHAYRARAARIAAAGRRRRRREFYRVLSPALNACIVGAILVAVLHTLSENPARTELAAGLGIIAAAALHCLISEDDWHRMKCEAAREQPPRDPGKGWK